MAENSRAFQALEPDYKHKHLHGSALLLRFIIPLTRNVWPSSVLMTLTGKRENDRILRF